MTILREKNTRTKKNPKQNLLTNLCNNNNKKKLYETKIPEDKHEICLITILLIEKKLNIECENCRIVRKY